jgi:hypothetical protein
MTRVTLNEEGSDYAGERKLSVDRPLVDAIRKYDWIKALGQLFVLSDDLI